MYKYLTLISNSMSKSNTQLDVYQKFAKENNIMDNYMRSEYFKSSSDIIQALKLLIEQLNHDTERTAAFKEELELETKQYSETLNNLMAQNKVIISLRAFRTVIVIQQLKEDIEQLAEENERYKLA